MPAVVTDQFRILNASNFVDTVTGVGGTDPSSSFYVSVSLPNPTVVGFGRTSTWAVSYTHLTLPTNREV